MQRDHLVGRVFGGGVDPVVELGARRRGVVVGQQFVTETAGEYFEVRLTIERKTTKQDAADTRQLGLDRLQDLRSAVLPGGTTGWRLEDERQGPLVARKPSMD